MNFALRRFALLWVAASLCFPCQAQLPGASPSQVAGPQIAGSTSAADPDVADPLPPPDVASQVRIVRLSQVRGSASMERSAGGGFAPAFPNLPVISGARLRTVAGVAEVEFEDGSTLRVTPGSAVDFQQLGRSAAGATISELVVLEGSVYVSLARTRDNVFTLIAGKARMRLSPRTHLRLDVGVPGPGPAAASGKSPESAGALGPIQKGALGNGGPDGSVAVFEGEVDFSNPAGHRILTGKRTLSFLTDGANPPVLVTRIEQAPFDAWDKQGVQYQKRYSGAALAGSGFGASDLNYYGGFADLAGCGSVWRPYFANAAWDPFDNGIWAWYGSAGYSWISPYPWGWLPFHTGAWQFCGTGGWGWRPGGAWYGLPNQPRFFLPVVYGVKPPPRPPHPPSPGQARLAMVNVKPLPVSSLNGAGEFTFSKNSAGVGVPRESFHRLRRESATVDRKGFATKNLDVERYSLPSSNRLSAAPWTAAAGANAGLAGRPAGTAHSGEDRGRNRDATAPGRASRPASPYPGGNGTPRGSSGANGGTGAPHAAPMGPSPSVHPAPAGTSPSSHSAPAPSGGGGTRSKQS